MKCHYCGASINKGDLFCQNCGKKPEQVVEFVKEGVTKNQCPHCGAIVNEGDTFCQNCGKKQEDVDNAAKEIIAEKKCPHCGSAVKGDEAFCHNCGINLSKITKNDIRTSSNTESVVSKAKSEEQFPSRKTISPRGKKKKQSWIIPLIFFIVCLVALGVGWLISSHSALSNDIDAEIAVKDSMVISTIYDYRGDAIQTFNGKVVDGKPNGIGTLIYLNNDLLIRYEGKLNNGLREDSSAALFYKNGDIYRGAFKDDNLYIGTYFVEKSGEYFRGTFKDAKPWKGYWYNSLDYIISKVVDGKKTSIR